MRIAEMYLEQTSPFRHNAIPLLNQNFEISYGDDNGDPRWSPRDDKL